MFYFKTHAARTGHQNFAESTEEIKPLTEEEKKQQRERLATVVVIFFLSWVLWSVQKLYVYDYLIKVIL